MSNMHVLLYADCDDNNNNQDEISFEYTFFSWWCIIEPFLHLLQVIFC